MDGLIQKMANAYSHRWKKFHQRMIGSTLKRDLLLSELPCVPSYSGAFLSLLRQKFSD